MHARIELFGGPQDGHEITIPISADGAPISQLPVPSPDRHFEADDRTEFEAAWYEKHHQRGGVWIYHYTTAHTVRQRTSTS